MIIENKYSMQGGSLLEALVALLVFAFGALGIAALQATSLIRSDDARQRSAVIWKALELVERINSNRGYPDQTTVMAAYQSAVGAVDLSSIPHYSHSQFRCSSTPPPACAGGAATAGARCSLEQLARFDVWSVFCDPSTGLVSGQKVKVVGRSTTVNDLDVALVEHGLGHNLYVKWASRANQRRLQKFVRTVNARACENDISIDARVEVYCVAV